jgi:PAT family beta-lactamase induction signal transducer AmpG
VPALLLMCSFRLNYMSMGIMANPFYVDLGFSLKDIAAIVKVYGVLMALGGAACASLLATRLGLVGVLLIGNVLLSAANLVYGYCAGIHPDRAGLTVMISIDNFANGIAGTAFIAYMSTLTNPAYTATQYALFGTLWSLPAKWLAGYSGDIADAIGYPWFFAYTAALGLPPLLLLLWMRGRNATAPPAAPETAGI